MLPGAKGCRKRSSLQTVRGSVSSGRCSISLLAVFLAHGGTFGVLLTDLGDRYEGTGADYDHYGAPATHAGYTAVVTVPRAAARAASYKGSWYGAAFVPSWPTPPHT